ncbi:MULTISPECIES: carbohydrate ABC transporter permease [Streptomyces]|uniref:carbohydrate ABC transporter permease n=1 Tax=Streptomyces TaxID=1883 RepID=UPI001884B70C|nr:MULTISPECIES: carbohydrate ABC transporter permease [Streptomyces]MBZ6142263.1 carbohydrate ABC transporter permease [Streptomyces olivaceus]MBZ6170034.1 carbohydrate ABC transporter permease [Streptomyces olivaceus]MBZ6176441.1 carbohydrate ABC transporter permease [Streptomyces olivaceus]MBZ6183497.1 carbohydrate ABC transporter permease [Streptomyces olivaceus]MCM8551292.1 carbohydrate ABC transporter permease [Streptomyces sp. STCH 565 A]
MNSPAAPLSSVRPYGRIVVNAVVGLSVLYTLLPLVWLLLASTVDSEALFASDFFDLSNFALVDNVRALLAQDDGAYLTWYRNSLLYAVGGAAVGALISTAAGYVFDKFEFTGKRPLFALILISVMVPATVIALPLYLLASDLGLANTVWSVLIPLLFNPFGVYLARMFSASYVPDEVLEAARVDGANELRSFFSVGLRMLAPGYVTIFLFQLTAIWNNFFLPLVMLNDTELYPLSLGLYSWNSTAPINPDYYPLMVIGSLLALLPLVVAFLLLQRFWRSGLTAGSVK